LLNTLPSYIDQSIQFQTKQKIFGYGSQNALNLVKKILSIMKDQIMLIIFLNFTLNEIKDKLFSIEKKVTTRSLLRTLR